MDILTSSFGPLAGVEVGHWTDTTARTGCTVIRLARPALTAVDVRGAASGSRELDLLGPGRIVRRADAILLTGGSAFGLAAAEGVVRWLREHGRGFPTPAGPVPIVPAAVIFDLAIGSATWPGPDDGYSAVANAAGIDRLETGQVGAGTGATLGAIGGPDAMRIGGFISGQVVLDEGAVTAFVVANPYGTLWSPDAVDPRMAVLDSPPTSPPLGVSTTLLACVTDLPLDHDALHRMTVAMHDGLARSIAPVHTIADGDIAFASTVNDIPRSDTGTTMRACLAAELAVEAAFTTLRGDTSRPR